MDSHAFVASPVRMCSASPETSGTAKTAVRRPEVSQSNDTQPLMVTVASTLLSLGPVRKAAMRLGREKVLNDAKRVGVDWSGEVAQLKAAIPGSLEPLRKSLIDDSLVLPEYYLVPFHAYQEGNLGWVPALEAGVSSTAVHAKFCAEDPLKGDDVLRGNAVDILAGRWRSSRGDGRDTEPRDILDVGCSVGLSSMKLAEQYPRARVVGADASAEMLAVGAMLRPEVEYRHALGEKLPKEFESSFDVVSVQLVFHELPAAPMQGILAESLRVLRPGGMLCIMDVRPNALGNIPPVIRVLFEATEPYFKDHAARDLREEISKAGFENIEVAPNTPNHGTFTAFKAA